MASSDAVSSAAETIRQSEFTMAYTVLTRRAVELSRQTGDPVKRVSIDEVTNYVTQEALRREKTKNKAGELSN